MCSSDGNVAQVPKQTDSGPMEQETSIDEILGLQVGMGCPAYIVLKVRHVKTISYGNCAEPLTSFSTFFLFVCFTVQLSLSNG